MHVNCTCSNVRTKFCVWHKQTKYHGIVLSQVHCQSSKNKKPSYLYFLLQRIFSSRNSLHIRFIFQCSVTLRIASININEESNESCQMLSTTHTVIPAWFDESITRWRFNRRSTCMGTLETKLECLAEWNIVAIDTGQNIISGLHLRGPEDRYFR